MQGDAAARRKLLSRPEIEEDDEPYYEAWQRLHEERDKVVISGAMGGGVVVPEHIARERIRREAELLGFDGHELESFLDILIDVDRHWVLLAHQRIQRDVRQQVEARGQKG